MAPLLVEEFESGQFEEGGEERVTEDTRPPEPEKEGFFREDPEDEETARELLGDLLERFMDAYEVADDVPALLDAAMRFAALATQVGAYDLAAVARDLDESPEAAASGLIRMCSQLFLDHVTNQEMFATTGKVMDQPPLGLKLDRKFRRSL